MWTSVFCVCISILATIPSHQKKPNHFILRMSVMLVKKMKIDRQINTSLKLYVLPYYSVHLLLCLTRQFKMLAYLTCLSCFYILSLASKQKSFYSPPPWQDMCSTGVFGLCLSLWEYTQILFFEALWSYVLLGCRTCLFLQMLLLFHHSLSCCDMPLTYPQVFSLA